MKGSILSAAAVLGHESAGVVEEVGSEVTHVKPGDHVVTCLSAFCGHCENCLDPATAGAVSPTPRPRRHRAILQPALVGTVAIR